MEDLQLENKLTTQYDKLIASAEIEFDGKNIKPCLINPRIHKVLIEKFEKQP